MPIGPGDSVTLSTVADLVAVTVELAGAAGVELQLPNGTTLQAMLDAKRDRLAQMPLVSGAAPAPAPRTAGLETRGSWQDERHDSDAAEEDGDERGVEMKDFLEPCTQRGRSSSSATPDEGSQRRSDLLSVLSNMVLVSRANMSWQGKAKQTRRRAPTPAAPTPTTPQKGAGAGAAPAASAAPAAGASGTAPTTSSGHAEAPKQWPVAAAAATSAGTSVAGHAAAAGAAAAARAIVVSRVVWSCQLEGRFQPYEPEVCRLLEEAYERGDTEARITVRNKTYTIDLVALKQRAGSRLGRDRPVRRTPPDAAAGVELGPMRGSGSDGTTAVAAAAASATAAATAGSEARGGGGGGDRAVRKKKGARAGEEVASRGPVASSADEPRAQTAAVATEAEEAKEATCGAASGAGASAAEGGSAGAEAAGEAYASSDEEIDAAERRPSVFLPPAELLATLDDDAAPIAAGEGRSDGGGADKRPSNTADDAPSRLVGVPFLHLSTARLPSFSLGELERLDDTASLPPTPRAPAAVAPPPPPPPPVAPTAEAPSVPAAATAEPATAAPGTSAEAGAAWEAEFLRGGVARRGAELEQLAGRAAVSRTLRSLREQEAQRIELAMRQADRVAQLHAAWAHQQRQQERQAQLQVRVAAVVGEWRRAHGPALRGLLAALDAPEVCALLAVSASACTKLADGTDLGARRRAYLNAVRRLHPDKLASGAKLREKVAAAAIFDCLREAYDKETRG